MNYYNLLPEDAQASLKLEYRLRTGTLYALGVCAAIIVGMVGLFSVWVLLQSDEARLSAEQGDLATQNQARGKTPAKVIITETREKLSVLSSRAQAPLPSSVFDTIIAAKLPGLSITKISYTAADGKLSGAEVTGVAAAREDLIAFTNGLQASGVFGGVDLPVDVFARSANIPFTITLRPPAAPKP